MPCIFIIFLPAVTLIFLLMQLNLCSIYLSLCLAIHPSVHLSIYLAIFKKTHKNQIKTSQKILT